MSYLLIGAYDSICNLVVGLQLDRFLTVLIDIFPFIGMDCLKKGFIVYSKIFRVNTENAEHFI